MEKKLIAILIFISVIGFILAVDDIPVFLPHQFYGEARYNDQLVSGRCSITAEINEQTQECVMIDGKYGYGPLCILLSDVDETLIEFYLQGNNLIGEHIFANKNNTRLDFNLSFNPNCPADNNGGSSSSSSGGGGGGSSSSSSGGGGGRPSSSSSSGGGSSLKNNLSGEGQNYDVLNTKLNNEGNSQTESGSKITGGVIGFAKSGFGIGLIFTIVLLAVGTFVIFLAKEKAPRQIKIIKEISKK